MIARTAIERENGQWVGGDDARARSALFAGTFPQNAGQPDRPQRHMSTANARKPNAATKPRPPITTLNDAFQWRSAVFPGERVMDRPRRFESYRWGAARNQYLRRSIASSTKSA